MHLLIMSETIAKKKRKPLDSLGRPNNGGRPLKQIDENLIRELSSNFCTMEQMARIAKCSVDTLENRFSDIIKDGRANGKYSILQKQFEMATKHGNVALLIWLGKQHLGQREPIQDYNVQQLHSESREKLAEVDSKKLLEIVLKEQKMQGL